MENYITNIPFKLVSSDTEQFDEITSTAENIREIAYGKQCRSGPYETTRYTR